MANCSAGATHTQELTRSSVHTMGGKAELSLENAEEPFLGGIKFFAVPPTKRYRDMDMLSGGEKTVAALSLLFAIHTCDQSKAWTPRLPGLCGANLVPGHSQLSQCRCS